jgi:hypothetical protein
MLDNKTPIQVHSQGSGNMEGLLEIVAFHREGLFIKSAGEV